MDGWLRRLGDHYRETRKRCPEHELLVLFDVDGTVLDLRHMMLHVLRGYDRHNGTNHFRGLELDDVTVHENQVERLPRLRRLPPDEQERVKHWYLSRRWRPEAIFASHRPYRGVMELIRWFQLQPRTSVGLNTGRPESLRPETLFSLNALGEEYRVQFRDDLLHMNPGDRSGDVEASKAEGVEHFRRMGYVVFAMVDNEPANLEAVSEVDPEGEVLLLHADTLFESRRERLPEGAVSGRDFRLGELAAADGLPRHVRFVWQGVNDRRALRVFLSSGVTWAQADVGWAPRGVAPAVQAVDAEGPSAGNGELLLLEEVLAAVYGRGKAVKLHLHAGGRMLDRLEELAQDVGIPSDRVAFRGRPEVVEEEGFRRLRRAFPMASLEVPLGSTSRLLRAGPERARRMLEVYRGWGVDQVSLPWGTPGLAHLLERIQEQGLAVDLHGAPELEAFLRSALLLPDSVTAPLGPGTAQGDASRPGADVPEREGSMA